MKWYETHFLDQIRHMDNFIELCKVGFCRAFTWSWISWGILGLWLCFWCLRATGRVQKLWWKLNFVVWTHAFFFLTLLESIWFDLGGLKAEIRGRGRIKLNLFYILRKKWLPKRIGLGRINSEKRQGDIKRSKTQM